MNRKRGFYDAFVHTCAKYPSRIAMRCYENNEYKCYTYSEMYGVCEYIAQQLQLMNCKRGVIGLICSTNILIPCLIAAAHKFCTSFMFLDPQKDLTEVIEDMSFTIVISITEDDKSIIETPCKTPDKDFTVFGLVIRIYNYSELASLMHYNYTLDYSYIAVTSGSTGEPKKIQVPLRCIQPNITDLTKLFHITPDDVIYFSTPLTFDPSMVEILLAGMNGASLLIAPPVPEILFPKNRRHSITVWQTTPSNFFQLANLQIKNKVLSANSTLKILALGGEPLHGTKRLKELKHPDNKTKIFTLYGVTEMSCWACVAELDLNKISDFGVPLGKCLSETKVILDKKLECKTSGSIVLVSNTRNCIILNKKYPKSDVNSVRFLDTGDLGEQSTCGTIYYKGRKDDVIKRFGHKINLQLIESTVMHCPRIKTCSCIWLPKPRLLVVYYCSDAFNSQDLSDFLKCKLDDKHWPDRIIRVGSLPTTTHGKTSKLLLSKMLESNIYDELKISEQKYSIHPLQCKVLEETKNILQGRFTYDQIKHKDFFSIGGNSFLAVAMCNKIAATHPEFGRNLLPELMNHMQTIEQAIENCQQRLTSPTQTNFPAESSKLKKKISTDLMDRSSSLNAKKRTSADNLDISWYLKSSKNKKKSDSEESSSLALDFNPFRRANSVSHDQLIPVEFIKMWTYNTGKCVDATPAILISGLNLYVIVGSHAGKVVIVDAMTAIVVSVIDLKSRVEASVCCHPGEGGALSYGIVGAYNGIVVCFTIETGLELWRSKTGSMIKSKAVCCNDLVYVASYDGFIRSFDLMTGVNKHAIMAGDQAITADLVLAKQNYIMVGSLSGVCCGVDTCTNTVMWRSVLKSPVFANPVVYDSEKYVVFAEVSGEIHCRTVLKGLKIWVFSDAKANIFSSISILEINKSEYQMVFGCHDHCVYSIIVKNCQSSLHWKAKLGSPVYSTPCFINDKYILAASNDGKLVVITASCGTVIADYALPDQTFSSPVVYQGEYVFIGCRNDLLYSLRCILNP